MTTLVARYSAWRTRHPWLDLLIAVALFVLLFALLPPRHSLGLAVVYGISFLVLYLAINYACYRTLFPTKGRIQEAEREAARIAAVVRERRDHLV
jgi:hypothetical protein